MARNQSVATLIVDSGSVVGMTVASQASFAPSPTAQTHLVPPSSIPPYGATRPPCLPVPSRVRSWNPSSRH